MILSYEKHAESVQGITAQGKRSDPLERMQHDISPENHHTHSKYREYNKGKADGNSNRIF